MSGHITSQRDLESIVGNTVSSCVGSTFQSIEVQVVTMINLVDQLIDVITKTLELPGSPILNHNKLPFHLFCHSPHKLQITRSITKLILTAHARINLNLSNTYKL